jgi:hypothetical protein
MRLSVAGSTLLLAVASVLAVPPARAYATNTDEVLDAAALADLEARAEHAQASEQAFLYTELIHDYVEVAGKQVAAGDMDQATASLERVQKYADRIHANLGKSSKRVKNAEMLMHLATYKLAELMHVISTEDSAMLQATLKRLDKLHDELLQAVFAH